MKSTDLMKITPTQTHINQEHPNQTPFNFSQSVAFKNITRSSSYEANLHFINDPHI